MKYTFSILVLLATVFAQTSPAFGAYSDTEARELADQHIQFVLTHGYADSVGAGDTKLEIVSSPEGKPVSLIFHPNGISAFFTTEDGTVIHTLFKWRKAFLGLPDGLEIGFNVSVSQTPLLEFHRVYGFFEPQLLIGDLKALVATVRDKEWRDNTKSSRKCFFARNCKSCPS